MVKDMKRFVGPVLLGVTLVVIVMIFNGIWENHQRKIESEAFRDGLRETLASPTSSAEPESTPVVDSETGSDEGVLPDDPCQVLTDEAVRISSESGDGVSLLKVRAPVLVRDARTTYTPPVGSKDAVLVVCEGAGVWSDMSKTDVRVRATIDADEDVFVDFRPIW